MSDTTSDPCLFSAGLSSAASVDWNSYEMDGFATSPSYGPPEQTPTLDNDPVLWLADYTDLDDSSHDVNKA